jgi:hypothetical protein
MSADCKEMSSEQARLSFEECAQLSGLLAAEQIQEIVRLAVQRWGAEALSDPTIRGERLAEVAVELGLLNQWQARQLLEGRIKFTLGSYRVIDSLGRGGVGQVFKAVHELLEREVAIKVLPKERATPERIEQFLREIRTLASLDHPHLVRALDAGRDGGVYYLVLEYVPGLNLRKYVQGHGPLGEEEAANIIAQVALGLDYAHRRGFVHRDVKPGNVLVTAAGVAKLSDLGFASSVFEEELSDSRSARIVGTADYLAPDHIQAPWDPKPAWDIYSLGCTLYYAVTGRVPFPEGTTEEKLRAHLEKEPVDPRELNPGLSPAFVAVLKQMMAKDPQSRPASAREVVLRLGPWLDPAILPGEFAMAVVESRAARRQAADLSQKTEALTAVVAQLGGAAAGSVGASTTREGTAPPGGQTAKDAAKTPTASDPRLASPGRLSQASSSAGQAGAFWNPGENEEIGENVSVLRAAFLFVLVPMLLIVGVLLLQKLAGD